MERAGRTAHRAHNLTFHDFGTTSKPAFCFHAAQTNTYLEFLNEVLSLGKADAIPDIVFLRQVGRALQTLYAIPKEQADPLLPTPPKSIQVKCSGSLDG